VELQIVQNQRRGGGLDRAEQLDDRVVVAVDREAQADTAKPPRFSAGIPSMLLIETPADAAGLSMLLCKLAAAIASLAPSRAIIRVVAVAGEPSAQLRQLVKVEDRRDQEKINAAEREAQDRQRQRSAGKVAMAAMAMARPPR
jgi:hypothetical protein